MEDEETNKECFFCGRYSVSYCPCDNYENTEAKRKNIFYCCEEHQQLHRPINSDRCFPYEIKFVEGKGRCLFATRKIFPGDLIFRETAIIAGPLHETVPVCLTCWKKIDGNYKCGKCLLPMCRDEECRSENSVHGRFECKLFSRKKRKINIRNFNTFHPFYQCITPLRCLLLKSTPEKWECIRNMMDHLEDKPRDINWEITQKNIVDYLLKIWSYPSTPHELNHIVGALEVNAFELWGDHDGKGRGLFPLTALMSHSCVSNTRYTMFSCNYVECRANIAIEPAQELTDHYVSPLQGTRSRRGDLRQGWFFDCGCERCRDPTEGGSFLSGINCDKCGCVGVVDENERLFRCNRCDNTNNDKNYNSIEDELNLKLNDIENKSSNYKELEDLLKECRQHNLSESHYIVISIKRYLIYIYGRNPELFTNEELLSKKLKYCEDILRVCEIVTPGWTKERGLTLYEKVSVTFAQIKTDPSMSKKDTIIKLGLAVESFKEITNCLRYERPQTFEYWILNSAQKQYKECKELVSLLKIM